MVYILTFKAGTINPNSLGEYGIQSTPMTYADTEIGESEVSQFTRFEVGPYMLTSSIPATDKGHSLFFFRVIVPPRYYRS